MDKVLIAICGKSATGKDTVARQLLRALVQKYLPVHFVVSDTTRMQRRNEKDGTDYHFVSKLTFLEKLSAGKYIESTEFNNNFYGISTDEFKDGFNIAVVDPNGIKHLMDSELFNYTIPVFLELNWPSRLKRAKERENQWSFEYIRRMFADFKDFLGFKTWLKHNSKVAPIIIKQTNSNNGLESSLLAVNEILKRLNEMGKL